MQKIMSSILFFGKSLNLGDPNKQCDSYKGLFSNQLNQSLHIINGKKNKNRQI